MVSYDIYANGTDDLKASTAEKIEDYITSLTLESASQDMEALFNSIKELGIYSLKEKEVENYVREIKRVTYIPKIQEQVINLILKLSNIDNETAEPEDNQERLNLIYTLLNNMEEFKEQTINIQRNTNNYADDYKNVFLYLQTTQHLLKSIQKASEYRTSKQPAIIQRFVINY